MKNSIKTEIFELLEKNKMQEAFGLIKEAIDQNDENYNDFIMLSRRFNDNNKCMINATIDHKTSSREKNKICQALLDLVNRIDNHKFNTATVKDDKHKSDEIDEQITVFTNSEGQMHKLQNILNVLRFNNVNFLFFKQYIEDKLDFNNLPELIIFDNYDLPNEEKDTDEEQKKRIKFRSELMDEILSNCPNSYFLHYGQNINWLNDAKKRLRVNAANSPITLYARIKEIIQFMNAYRV